MKFSPNNTINIRSHFLPVPHSEHRLHVKAFLPLTGELPRASVFLLHGAIEDGRIFYSQSGKGFAPFLAQAGYAVYVLDLRGRGLSHPAIDKFSQHGQKETILEDIPQTLHWIKKRHPRLPMIWGAHSWGGVLISCVLARFPEWLEPLNAMLFFGSKRRVAAPTWQRRVHIGLVWNLVSFGITRSLGYLPGAKLGLGSDSETRQSHADSVRWVKSKSWQDPDGFDYAKMLQSLRLPRQLHLAGPWDHALGHPDDVRRFQAELGGGDESQYLLLSRQHGFKNNYGHIDMLTHPQAPQDHFPAILRWLEQGI